MREVSWESKKDERGPLSIQSPLVCIIGLFTLFFSLFSQVRRRLIAEIMRKHRMVRKPTDEEKMLRRKRFDERTRKRRKRKRKIISSKAKRKTPGKIRNWLWSFHFPDSINLFKRVILPGYPQYRVFCDLIYVNSKNSVKSGRKKEQLFVVHVTLILSINFEQYSTHTRSISYLF